MQWISRPFALGGNIEVERILVPDGQTPGFWNSGVDAIVDRLRNGAAFWNRPTVPMSGGLGTLHTESRHLLCQHYLYAESSERLAYIQLGLVGQTNTAGVFDDKRQAKETRLCDAVWLSQNPIVIEGVDIANVAGPSLCWTLVFAARYELARHWVGARDLYEQSVDRCRGGGTIQPVDTDSGLGFPVKALSPDEIREWQFANANLAIPALAAGLLVRVTKHVIDARLFVVMAEKPQKDRRLFTQMRDWLQGVVNAPFDAGAAEHCDAFGGPHVLAVRSLLDALLALALFGGTEHLDPGTGYPNCFRPYAGGPAPRLDLLLVDVDPAHHSAFSQAYLLGVLIVDKLMDMLQAQQTPRQRQGFFDRFAYSNLEQMMKTTRRKMGWARLDLPHSATRLQLQRHVVEMANPSERCVKKISSLLQREPMGAPAQTIACAICRALHQPAAQGGGHV